MKPRLRPPPGPAMRLVIAIVRPLSSILTRRIWQGQERIPPTGGVIIAANHLSWADPFTLGHFVYSAQRVPRFMAKESLFRFPVTGQLLRSARQIPVNRGERDGSEAMRAAADALSRGEAVLIYPEGTITGDPQGWPMRAKTGVARLALMSGAPIVPVAQWGPQDLLPAFRRLRFFPRHTVRITAGEPLHPPFLGEHPDREELRVITGQVMSRIRLELEVLRGENAPSGVWDPRLGERVAAESSELGPGEGAA